MAFLGNLCCCFPSQRRLPSAPTLHQQPHDPEGGFRRCGGVSGDTDAPGIDEPYLSTAPLPRYTPRPISIHEKTLAIERPQSNSIEQSDFPCDEKNRYEFERELTSPQLDDHSSDASSEVSVPSSFGNTSTATTETPPPPYSCNSSRAPSRRSMAMSVSTHGTGFTYASLESVEPESPVAQLPLAPPAAVYRSHPSREVQETSGREYRRSSEASQGDRQLPTLPPSHSRGE
ncbi:hypothetical protein AJ78_03025 [Emergomyces pasteurianus Ep9510]|uniref:Uncharacterized protein n=1 Tax=Emergomyces pasteurianus Ep9510 TaxID=1447872 RepID=A0A1J9Q9B9_9EURO|nr:hypothetical protein AJ78_03025 [Emergomyces pasteurianus Ep9510]